MAYQPKSYRKLFATTASAAMIATAIAPAASAAELKFTDVEGQYVAPVQYLVDNGITQGVTDTKFGTHDNITRSAAAIMIARALNLDTENAPDAGFKDVNDRTRGAINAVKEAGYLNGLSATEFGSDLPMNRQALAVLIANAFELEASEDVELPFTDVYAGSRYEASIKAVYELGITKGTTATTFGSNDPVTRGQFAVFLQRAATLEDETPAPELKVESVSAINSTTVQVTFSEEVDTAIASNFIFSNGVTAKSVEIDGDKVLVTTSDIPSNVNISIAVDGVVGVSGGTVDNVTSSFRFNVEAATTIQGFVTNASGAVSGATVKAGEAVVTTNKDGYYVLPANPGLVKVEVTKAGHFVATEHVDVSRNNETAENFVLAAIDVDELAIEGNVLDEKTGASVEGALVTLQAKNGAEWEDVASIETDAEGDYGFYNSTATDADDNVTDGTSELQFTDILGRINVISADTEYRVVVSKDLASDNLDNVYTEKTQTFKSSNAKALTEIGTKLTPVAKIDTMDIKVAWDSQVTSQTGLTVDLLATDGKTVLSAAGGESVTVAPAANDAGLDEAKFDLVDELTAVSNQYVTLPTGTYYARINDGANAVAIVPITVTAGTNTSSSVEIEEAQTVTATSNFSSFPSGVGTVPVTGGIDVYKTIGGVDVLVTTLDDADLAVAGNAGEITYTEGASDLTASLAFEQADVTTYKLVASGDYIDSPVSSSITVRKDAVNTKNLEVDPAGTASTVLGLLDAAGAALDLPDSTLVPITVELLDANGTKVDSDVFNTYDDRDNSADADTVENASFLSVTPGKYKVKVSAPGFETKTSDEFTVTEFQDNASDAIDLKANPEVTVEGYVRFADDLEPVADTVEFDGNGAVTSPLETSNVYVYDQDGEYLTSTSVTNGTYTLTGIDAGAYTLVARGYGQFETVAQTVNVNVGEQTVNFEVAEGAQAIANLTLVDDIGAKVANGDVTVAVTDAWFDADTTVGPNDPSDVFVTTATAGTFVSPAIFSAGSLAVSIGSTKYVDTTTQITAKLNETVYKRINLENAVSGVTYDITGDVLQLAAGVSGYVAAIDVNGNVVDVAAVTNGGGAAADIAYTLTVPNGSYTLVTLVDDNFVAAKTVTVEDADVDPINFSLTTATR